VSGLRLQAPVFAGCGDEFDNKQQAANPRHAAAAADFQSGPAGKGGHSTVICNDTKAADTLPHDHPMVPPLIRPVI
jgi:hypothetical protein